MQSCQEERAISGMNNGYMIRQIAPPRIGGVYQLIISPLVSGVYLSSASAKLCQLLLRGITFCELRV